MEVGLIQWIFLCYSCWIWPWSITFLLLTSAGCLCTGCSCWECKSVFSVWWLFKNSKWIILQLYHHTHSITFLPWNSSILVQLRRFIFVNPLSMALNIVIKDPFFISCNDILKKWVICLPWKKTFGYGYVIFLI